MWLFTVFGYYSIIQHNKDPELLLVRSRVKGDLEKLKGKYLKNLGDIVETPIGADYPYRALAWKSELASAMKQVFLDIDYTNFKSEVSKKQGSPRHDLYMRVWGVMKHAEEDMKQTSYHDSKVEKGSKGWNGNGKEQLGFFQEGGADIEILDLVKSRKAREERLRECHTRFQEARGMKDEDKHEETLEEALAYSYGVDTPVPSEDPYWCPKCRLYGGHYKGCTYHPGER